MKKILIFLASFIIGISNIPAAHPTEITTPNPVIPSELNLGGDEIGIFGRIPAYTKLYSAGPDLKDLPGLITSAYTFSNELKNKINEIIVDLYAPEGKFATLHKSDVAIRNSLITAVSNINHAIAANDVDIGNIFDKLNKVINTGYNYSKNSENLSQTSGYIHLNLDEIVSSPDKVFSGYLNKANKPNITGYYLNLNIAHNHSSIIPGKVYKCFFTGNNKFNLVVRNTSPVESSPRIFVHGGAVTDANFTEWYDSTNTKLTYKQYSSGSAYQNYFVEIQSTANQLYITIHQSNYSLAPPQNIPKDIAINTGYTLTWLDGGTEKIYTPRIESHSKSYEWARNAGNHSSVEPRHLALTVKLQKSVYPKLDMIKGKITLLIKFNNSMSGGYGPRIYLTNHDNSDARIYSNTLGYVQMPGGSANTTATKDEWVQIKYHTSDGTYHYYRLYIRAKACGNDREGFWMRINNITNMKGNPTD